MNDPMSKGGIWPAVKPGRIVRYDFLNRRPLPEPEQFVDDQQVTGPTLSGVYYGDPDVEGIPLQVLLVAVVLAGVIVCSVGYMVSAGVFDVVGGARFVAFFMGGFAVRLMLETK